MADPIDNITDTAKDLLEDAKEVVRQRFFSPMYFYFILSWIITNWKFLYVLFSVEQSDMKIWKLHYLMSFYPMNGFWVSVWSISKLILIPAFSAYIFVWWFSRLSERFYERNETFKLNKETIKRKLDYEEKVKIAEEKRKIREAEDDKEEIRYNDHQEFNDYLDEGTENITLYDADYLPSEVIYNTDPESYKDKLNKYLAEQGKDKSSI
ncbi:photosynthetic reaction center family protein [Mangrovimonas spongiae]|uniref:Uncharacterized protein n=1 Tax=Mangrovimonas spongiae TaxID=2494697 RepID=A0A428K1V3_9FLAO|nr:hypothetical protein [Mangrovimonas spongiae]RSK40410.1 hypothetical protein EJA19_05370 [Mangrovimonas spongiae]